MLLMPSRLSAGLHNYLGGNERDGWLQELPFIITSLKIQTSYR